MPGKMRKPETDPNTPLLQAASAGDEHMLRSLLDDGVHPDNKPAYGFTPLHAAIRGGHEAAVRLLLTAGANPETLYNPHRGYHWQEWGRQWGTDGIRQVGYANPSRGRVTPLNLAVAAKAPELVKLLLNAGADPGRACAMHQASAQGNPDVLQLLLASPVVDVNQRNGNGRTPLLEAVFKAPEDSRRAIVEALLAAGASVQVKGQRRPLDHALLHAQEDVVDLLMAHSSDLDPPSKVDLVHAAALGGTVHTLEHLKKQGLPLDARDDSGRTPLLAMLARGPGVSLDLRAKSEWLLNARADVLATDEQGNTALHYAVEHGLDDIRALLVEAGGNLLQANLDGVTPEQRAEEGRLITFHAPKDVDAYRHWAAQRGIPLSDFVHAALTLYKSSLESPEVIDGSPSSAPLPQDGNDWFHATVLPLIDMDPFVPGRLLPAFQAAASGGMQQLVDHRLLQECLCIEVAGPERGHLVTAVETYTRNLLTAALLWLSIRESGDASVADSELVLRAQGIHRMVSDHLVDRIQAYVAATILLRPLNSDRNAGDARSILDDIWARSTRPDSAQADTQFPVTAFDHRR